MAVQISREQIKNNAVNASKMLLTDTYSFTGGVLQAAAPTSDADVATKAYVDGLVSGLAWKAAVKAATTANITLSGTLTVDGVSLSVGDRILVKDQTDKTQNGIYIVDSGSWSRSPDMDAASEFPSAAVFVTAGTANGDLGFVCTNDSVVLGTTDIDFTQFNGAANIVAGDGLNKSGNTLSVNVSGGLAIINDNVSINDGGVTSAKIQDGAVTNAKLANSAISGVSLGSNLYSLAASGDGGLEMSSYNGSAVVSDLAVKLDGASLSKSAAGLKIATAGVGTVHLADNAVTTAKIGNLQVNEGKLANLAVTEGKIASAAVTAGKIASGAVLSDKLAAGAVVSTKIAAGAVQAVAFNSDVVHTTGAIGQDPTSKGLLVITDESTIEITENNDLAVMDGGISSAKLADTAVTEAKIASNAVTTSKIADGAVNANKLANGAVSSAKLTFESLYETLSAGNGSATTFDASAPCDQNLLAGVVVFRNGLAMGRVASAPSGQDQYTATNTGTDGVLRITFGSAPNSGDQITVLFMGAKAP
jgi:hypothetical protein